MDLSRIKIGVLGGGVSQEREISLLSAEGVYQALKRKGYDTVFIDISTSNPLKVKSLISSQNIGLAFIALHGEFGEDGKIQQILEELDIIYTGSGPKASLCAMDKSLSKDVFVKNGIPTPDFINCSNKKEVPVITKYPLVVKPSFLGSSLGVTIVKDKRGLKPALNKAFSYYPKVIIEDYIEGRELTVGILEDKAMGVVEIIPKRGYYDFNTKYGDNKAEFVVPAKLSSKVYDEVKRAGLAAHLALGCRHFSRVDIRLDKNNKPYILEVNSIPGLTSHSLLPLSAKVCGLDYDGLIVKMVQLAVYEKKTQKIKV
ncbi:MAG: D-alanine--D-alanine ligase [Candidatus Omnitrophica bacterium]|jgi:D-alanine-D-alanine ligase|nr:D-alanine--D-alanine ligase [Candidatus Omnitrophota bacterium]